MTNHSETQVFGQFQNADKLLAHYPVIEGCDVPDWLPFLTAAELGLDRPKLTIDFKTGVEYISYPVGWVVDPSPTLVRA